MSQPEPERDAFEKWAIKRYSLAPDSHRLERTLTGSYYDPELDAAWEAWQARAESGRSAGEQELRGLLDMAKLMIQADEYKCMCSSRGKCMAHTYLDKVEAALKGDSTRG